MAAHGWLIVTRDRHIQDRRAEIAAVREHEAKMVVLSSADAGSVWGQLEVLLTQWRRIEPLAKEAGPFVYTATRSSITAVALS